MKICSISLKRLALLCLTILAGVCVNAADFVSGGISYDIIDEDGHVVAVKAGETKYSGNIVIPDVVSYREQNYTVKAIGNYAFDSCTDLESVVVGSNVETIGYRAFHNCTSLKEINWSNKIRKYDSDAFQGCTSLTSVELSSSLEDMGDYVFSECINITSVTVNEGCAMIGASAFSGCI